MFKNVIVTAVRVAFKQKLTTLLNILGIALGIAPGARIVLFGGVFLLMSRM